MTYDEKIDAIIDIGESIGYLAMGLECPHFLRYKFESVNTALREQKRIAQSLFEDSE
jgi:hypothetical protein